MKKFGAVQDEFGLWQLHYVNSAHGSKNLCYNERENPDRKKCSTHDHPTAAEAGCCAIATQHISPEHLPTEMEPAKLYVGPVLPVPAEDEDTYDEIEVEDEETTETETVEPEEVEEVEEVDESGQVEDEEDEDEE